MQLQCTKKFNTLKGIKNHETWKYLEQMFQVAMTKVYKKSSLQPIFTQIKMHQLNSINKNVFNFLHLFNPM